LIFIPGRNDGRIFLDFVEHNAILPSDTHAELSPSRSAELSLTLSAED